MSRTDRIVSHLECYMDDLVECFEEFVKKSMLVISVAVGTLVLMVIYVLKLMSERAFSSPITSDATGDTKCFDKSNQVSTQSLLETADNIQEPFKYTKSLMNDYLPCANGTRTVSLQVIPNTYPYCDENYMMEIDLSITPKTDETCKQTQVSDDLKTARSESKSVTTRQSCVSKNHVTNSRRCAKFVTNQNSCCSMCCEDEGRKGTRWMP